MSSVGAISLGFSHWIDSAAGAVMRLGEHFARPRTTRIEQTKGDEFVVYPDQAGGATSARGFHMGLAEAESDYPAWLADAIAGSRVELRLQSDHFLFCPLELPRRAKEFLPGIVRAQIDRLTPWAPAAAAFGWSKPAETSGERMTVTIAATALAFIQPYCDVLANLGAHSIVVLASPPSVDATATPIKVWDRSARGVVAIARIRRVLMAMLGVCVVTTAVTAATATFMDSYFDTAQDEFAQKRTALRAAGRDTGGSTTGKRALVRRKYESPPAVVVLDALSDILPDHTYVTELRIEGHTVRLIGVTRDAPSLIELIERSGRFTRASFFGPTTRSASEPGERFHIEATIQPLTAVRS